MYKQWRMAGNAERWRVTGSWMDAALCCKTWFSRETWSSSCWINKSMTRCDYGCSTCTRLLCFGRPKWKCGFGWWGLLWHSELFSNPSVPRAFGCRCPSDWWSYSCSCDPLRKTHSDPKNMRRLFRIIIVCFSTRAGIRIHPSLTPTPSTTLPLLKLVTLASAASCCGRRYWCAAETSQCDRRREGGAYHQLSTYKETTSVRSMNMNRNSRGWRGCAQHTLASGRFPNVGSPHMWTGSDGLWESRALS